ncbi:MAG: protein kinase domain-containing protein [Pirellulaceae bacterium]
MGKSHELKNSEEHFESELHRFEDEHEDVLNLLDKLRARGYMGDAVTVDDHQQDTADLDYQLDPEVLAEIPHRIGRFEIKSLLGQGGFGLVFLAHDPRLKRDVALKIPRPEAVMTRDLRQRFLREAEMCAALNHANIVPVFEVGTAGPICYTASGVCHGMNLSQWMKQADELPHPKLTAAICATLCDALQHAHSRGIMHRDLKPDNIMIGDNSKSQTDPQHIGPIDTPHGLAASVQITDFGLAKAIDDTSEITRTGSIIGTPAYMAPEQTESSFRDSSSPCSDLYSLGAVLYFLLTGRSPFQTESLLETIRAVKERPPVAPARIRAAIPRDLEAICLKCLEKDPESRYQSASELHSDLDRFLNNRPVEARSITVLDRLSRWIKRNPLISGALAAAVVFLIAALVATTAGLISTNNALQRESAAKSEAVRQYEAVKEAIDKYYVKVAANPALKSTPGAGPVRQELLGLALEYYTQYVAENRNDPSLNTDIAETELRIGEILDDFSRFNEAREHFEVAEQLVDDQLQLTPDDFDLRDLHSRILKALASVHLSIGDLEKSSGYFDGAIALQQDLFDENPDDLVQLQRLARYQGARGPLLQQQGQFEDWVQSMEEANNLFEMALQVDNSDLDFYRHALINRGQLAHAYRGTGQADAAETLTRELAEESRQLVEDYPDFWEVHDLYVGAAINLSTFHLMRGEFQQILPELEHSQIVVDRLCWLHPAVEKYRDLKQGVLQRLAVVFQQSGDPERTVEIFGELVEMAREQLAIDESIVKSQFNLAQHIVNYVAFFMYNHRDLANGLELMGEADHLSTACAAAQPNNNDYKLLRVMVLDISSQLAYAEHRYRDAIQQGNVAIQVINDIRSTTVDDPKVKRHTAPVFQNLARAYYRLEQYADSADNWRLMLDDCPSQWVIDGQYRLAATLIRLGQTDEAESMTSEIDTSQLRREQHFNRARYHAVKAGSGNDEAQRIASVDQALASLQDAQGSGFLDAMWKIDILESGDDFDPLRDDQRFQPLLQELKADLGDGS